MATIILLEWIVDPFVHEKTTNGSTCFAFLNTTSDYSSQKKENQLISSSVLLSFYEGMNNVRSIP